jgi:hypothetical protein
MSTKKKTTEVPVIEKEELSAKELYDKKKEEKLKEKEKNKPTKKPKKKKKKTSTYETSLAGRIFAIIMLVLMAFSILTYIVAYFR